MKKSSLLKIIVVIGLSIVLAFNLVSVVRADDNDFSGWTDPDTNTTTQTNTADTANTTNTTDTSNTAGTTNTTGTTNTVDTSSSFTTNVTTDTSSDYNSTISTGNATTTINSTTSDDENEVNNLAYTGIENNSILVVVILVGAIIAGYSLKKVKEYNI